MNRENEMSIGWRNVDKKKFEVTVVGIDGLTPESKDDVDVLYPQDNEGILEFRYSGDIVFRLRKGLPDVAKHKVDVEPVKGRPPKLVVTLYKVEHCDWGPIWRELRRDPPDA